MTPPGPPAPKTRSSLAPLAAGVAALLIVLAGGAWWLLGAYRPTAVPTKAPTPVASNPTTPAKSKHLSIVVLPFANLSNDPSQDYFADGLTENLTTDLSRLSGSFVIARNTAFTFKGKNVDAREIGKELGVRYVLEGSVQRDADRIRVNVQLIDAGKRQASSGPNASISRWPIFRNAGRDRRSSRQPIGCGTDVCRSASGRTSIQSQFDGPLLSGLASLNKRVNVENMAQARGYFERALARRSRQPRRFARRWAGRLFGGRGLPVGRSDARLAAGEATVAKVLSQRPDDALAHEIMGGILNQTKRSDQGIAEFERALALNPNLATAQGDIGLAKIFVGHPEETGAHEDEALRLSPRDSFAWLWLHFAGAAKITLGATMRQLHCFAARSKTTAPNP